MRGIIPALGEDQVRPGYAGRDASIPPWPASRHSADMVFRNLLPGADALAAPLPAGLLNDRFDSTRRNPARAGDAQAERRGVIAVDRHNLERFLVVSKALDRLAVH